MRPIHFSTGHSSGPAARLLGLLAAVAVVVAGCASTPGQGDAGAEAPLAGGTVGSPAPLGSEAEALQAEVEAWLAGSDLPGVTAAVATDEGTWAGAAGVDGAGQPLVPESAMGIGSVTKTVTAAQVLLLADQGLVDLDAPVADYLDVPYDTDGATVRQLLGMQSGLPNPTYDVFGAASGDPQRAWTSADWHTLADQGVPGGRPGADFEYNNLNYIVLGDLIAATSGRTYAAAVRQDLLDPAGLDRFWVQDQEQPQAPVGTGVDMIPDLPLVDPDGSWLPSRALASALGAAGGIAADASSTASWGLALYTGRVLEPETLQVMTTMDDASGYGLGAEAWQDDTGMPVVGHGGDIVAYHSLLAVWPQDGTSVAVLAPQGGDRPDAPLQDWHLASLAQAIHDVQASD